jgi:hypothetical protein
VATRTKGGARCGAADAEWQAGALLLALMASGSTDDAEVAVAELFTGSGRSTAGRPDPEAFIGLARERTTRTGSRLAAERILAHRDHDRR